MENPSSKLKELWTKIRATFQENFSKNIINIGFMIYYIFYAIATLSTLLGAGELSFTVYWKVLVLALNLPVLVVTSLLLVGKWKGAQTHALTLENLYQVKLDLELMKKENEHLKSIQQLNHTIGDLTQDIQRIKEGFRKKLENEREINEYRCQLAAKNSKVPDAIIANKGWNDSNKTIEIIEKSEPKEDDAPTE